MNDKETWRERESGISVLAARHYDDDDEGKIMEFMLKKRFRTNTSLHPLEIF